MVANFAATVRVSTRSRNTWRDCSVCGALVALPPTVTTCPACTSTAPVRGRAQRAAA